MEFIINNKSVLEQLPALTPNGVSISSSSQPFIEANTIQISAKEISDDHIIPVWVTSNEPLISHSEFVESAWEQIHRMMGQEQILKPNIRVSHPIKGRIPEAKHKAAKDLAPWEQTLYYERMMFVIEIPSIKSKVGGNELSLTIGGVKSYGLDNLYGKRTQEEQHFQMFIGFQNKVCCNLNVWSDGLKLEHGIKNVTQLKYSLENLIERFGPEKHLDALNEFTQYKLDESDFAQVTGRARMYKHLPDIEKKSIPEVLLGDQQMGAVVKDFYKDSNFGNESGGDISLWSFYNLLTGANKTSYIDSILDRTVNAFDFTNGIKEHLKGKKEFWYMG